MALGCIGMSFDDFERCTPSEFWQVYTMWQERIVGEQRGGWERARMMCLCILQPYSKEVLKARDIMVFPWDSENEGSSDLDNRSPRQESRADLLALMEAVKKERGLL